jgi:hypothetical protein
MRQESISQGLKPNFRGGLDVQAKAWTYLKSKGNSSDSGLYLAG